MLNEEEKKIVEYLRMSPKDSLKRDAADLIERLNDDADHFSKYLNKYREIAKSTVDANMEVDSDIKRFKFNQKSSILQAIKDKFK